MEPNLDLSAHVFQISSVVPLERILHTTIHCSCISLGLKNNGWDEELGPRFRGWRNF
jgi:hypothetical protein